MSAKTPSYSKQLLLAVFLFVFGSVAYWLVYQKKPKEATNDADSKKVFVIGAARVKRLEIRGLKKESPADAAKKNPKEKAPPYLLNVALECESMGEKLCKPEDNSKWDLVEPLHASAEDTTVNSLLRNLGNLTTSDTVDLSTETPEKRESLLKDYGLGSDQITKPEERRIKLVLDDGRAFTAYFGEKHPISDGSFALLATGANGEPSASDKTKVFVVPDWQISVFTQKTSYFRDKKIIGGNERDVIGFTVAVSKNNGAKIEGSKDPKTTNWTLKSAGTETGGDLDSIEAVLSAANRLQAKDYAAERKDAPNGKKALAGAKLVYDLTMLYKDSTKRLRLYEKTNPKAPSTIYATLDGVDPLFEIDPVQLNRVDQKFNDLRMKKLIAAADRFGVDGMQITVKGKTPWKETLKKIGHSWTTAGGMALQDKVTSGILDQLTSPIVTSFKGVPPGSETLTIAFGTPEKPLGKDPAYEIEFWKKDKQLFARDLRSKKREIVELRGDFASQLPWNEGFLSSQ